ncbi:hypothetical protein H0H93_002005 [Arthromyces matolae]|nr:hypothetical protein H0H93_002005 [Arthromyces matolae]
MPKFWTTKEQHTWLSTYLDDYRERMSDQSYTPFWDRVYEDWEKKYPERVATFPDLSPTDQLTEEQLATLQKAIEKRQAQIQSWFRWRTQKKGRQADKNVSKQLQKVLLGSQERLPQLPHIYSDMFYETKIAPVVEQQTPKGATNADRFAIANRVTRAMFAAEDPAVVDQVRARFAELKREKDERAERLGLGPTLEDIENPTLTVYLLRKSPTSIRNLENLPAYMGRFLEFLHTSTGWSFSCIMGGPDPSMKNEISVKSYHVGWSPAGKDFSRHYRNYEEDVMVPYTEFLHSICARSVDEVSIRSSLGTDTGGPVIEGSTLKNTVHGAEGKENSKGDVNAGKESSPTPVTVVSAITSAANIIPNSTSITKSMDRPQAASHATPVTIHEEPAKTPAKTPSISPPNVSRGWNGIGGTDGVMSTLYSGFDGHIADNVSIPNIYDFDLSFNPPWHFGMSQCFLPTATQPGLDLTSTIPANISGPADLALSSVDSGPIYPAINTGMGSSANSVPSVSIIPGSAINSVSSIIPPTAINSVSSIIPPTAINSVSSIIPPTAINSVSSIIPPTAINSVSSIIPPTAINSVSSIIPPTAINSVPSMNSLSSAAPIISDPSINSADSGINSVPSIISNSSVTSVAPVNREPVYHFHDTTSVDFASDETTTTAHELLGTNPGNAVSRSGRLIVPSSRAEKLNEIGTTTVRVPDGKENVDPNNVSCPEWVNAAIAHFTTRDLGPEWTECVVAWQNFEKVLGYRSAKGLPGTKKRPEEWQRWTTKSKRLYSDTPTIRDPMEFGLAVVKWWKEIQPPVRQESTTLMPLAIKDIPNPDENMWTALRKGGPNGMITLVTLLAWWGQRAIIGNQYQEDSTPLWKECVVDVRTCLEEMTRTVPVPAPQGQKRSNTSPDKRGSKRVKKM